MAYGVHWGEDAEYIPVFRTPNGTVVLVVHNSITLLGEEEGVQRELRAGSTDGVSGVLREVGEGTGARSLPATKLN